jgi:hypothetical protein
MGNETADDLRQITSEDVPDPSSLPLDLSATPVDLSASRPRSLAIQPNLSSGNATTLPADLPPVQVFVDRGKNLSSTRIWKSLPLYAR